MEEKKTVSPEQIAEWKEKYGNVYVAEVDEKRAYLKQPTRKALGAAAVIGKSDPMRYNEVLLDNCWLGGDEEIKTNDALFLGVCGQLTELIEVKEATLKKL